ncbi:putative dnaJ molecular chaperone homology domain containing protein [Lyophyllum shimeji]|uniref:DnaJ molecular chaperone homology domain containing protein n=1 Tax=Lyophyllum shimeji TaxID=47721 RepID=A0A9P3UJY5_LYOSH|nr:putative dnaJ molecular chaperone homology domain containing protein [Lyophyllum shimeji]
MRLFYFLALLAVLATTVVAWEKEDHEIFDLVSEIETSEGKGTTFYSWLDVPPTASTAEIAKAYRKMSMQLHPDKNPGVKGIHERFARLGVVATILRNKESRKRYDFFYKNGVPRWRGTGYYYSRYRPGLGSVMVFLTILTSGLQLLVQRLNYRRDLERIEKFVREARIAAWGPKLTPIDGQRKVKITVGTSADGSPRWLEMVVEGQNVYILDPSGHMDLLDSSAAVYPTIFNTWFIALVRSLVRKALGSGAKEAPPEGLEMEEDDDGSSVTGSESGRSTVSQNGQSVRAPTVKAGGKRRKMAAKKRQ